MPFTRNVSQISTRMHLFNGGGLSGLLLLMFFASGHAATIYKCIDKDGNAIYADSPCALDTKTQQEVTASQAPSDSSRSTTLSLSPEMIAVGRDKSTREASALQCSTQAFNQWIKAQGHPLPDSNVRLAKLIEISNQCRRPLHLPDMIAPVPIAAPQPILSGPAGDAAATKLAQLVKSGSIVQLQKFLSSPGVDINDRPGSDKALLDYAAEQNRIEVAQFLLEHGARVDAAQTQGQNRGITALHRAATVDAAEVAEMLLAHGAEVNFHGPLGITPLILAASNGSRRTAEVLLNHGANIATPADHNETALSEATAHGHMDIVRLLLSHVPVPTTTSMNAVAARADLDALRLMLMHDELAHDVGTLSKNQALRMTILGGTDRIEERKQMIEMLLAHGANIDNLQSNPDVIPAMFATTPDMVEFLFAHGANREAKLPGAQLAQAFVCNDSVKDPLGVLQVLISHGIDIRGQPSARNLSAMTCAEHSGNSAAVQFLVAHGVAHDGNEKVTAEMQHVSATTLLHTDEPSIDRGVPSRNVTTKTISPEVGKVDLVDEMGGRTFQFLVEQCRSMEFTLWARDLGSWPDNEAAANENKELAGLCRLKTILLIEPILHDSDALPSCGNRSGTSLAKKQISGNTIANMSALRGNGAAKPDTEDFPLACKSSNTTTGGNISWLRTAIRGQNYWYFDDPLFSKIRADDGHLAMYKTLISSSTKTGETISTQLQNWTNPKAESQVPIMLLSLLHKKGALYTLLPLNYSLAEPTHTDIPTNPNSLSVLYDESSDNYLIYTEGASFLTSSWSRSTPSWEQFYIWWFDAKNETIKRQLLPAGPWVSDAKLDIPLLRDARNFSCGTDCYRHYSLAVKDGNLLVTITGRPSAISKEVTGIYKLKTGGKEWQKTDPPPSDPNFAN